jgi:tRNA (mo5U34)-methyltransferase
VTTEVRPNFNLQAPSITPRSETEAHIAALAPWFHNITLPSGEQTAPNHPLGDFPRFKWNEIKDHIPADLEGRTALDIGCNAGFYSLELAKRGARVHAIEPDEHYLEQAQWVTRQHALDHRIHYHALSIWDLADDRDELPASFDLVLFMGVFYHLRHPLLGLDIAAARTAGSMVFQTLTTADSEVSEAPVDLPLEERERLSAPGWPRMSFIEHSFATDETNWWVPNAACCEAMLRSAGLRVTSRPGHEIYVCEKGRIE